MWIRRTSISATTCCRTSATTKHAEARKRLSGRYEITGDQIDYCDDTRFTGWRLQRPRSHHAGMILYRDGKPAD
jgi:hypothetical protein